jgi:hypothetical protein
MTPNHMSAVNPRRRPATKEISGLIERVTFRNEGNGRRLRSSTEKANQE